jgi:hypothetical protein
MAMPFVSQLVLSHNVILLTHRFDNCHYYSWLSNKMLCYVMLCYVMLGIHRKNLAMLLSGSRGDVG